MRVLNSKYWGSHSVLWWFMCSPFMLNDIHDHDMNSTSTDYPMTMLPGHAIFGPHNVSTMLHNVVGLNGMSIAHTLAPASFVSM